MTNRKSQNSILFLTTFIFVAVSICVGQSNDEIELNRRPLIEFSESVKKQIQSGRVDLNAPFVFEASGKLDKSGRLFPSSFKITRSEGPADTLEIVKNAISAINDASLFQYLSALGVTDVTLLLEQDDALTMLQMSSETVNEVRPKTMKSLVDLSTRIAIEKKEKAQPRSDTDKCDLILLRGLSTSTSGKTFILKLELPKETVRDMIMAGVKTN